MSKQKYLLHRFLILCQAAIHHQRNSSIQENEAFISLVSDLRHSFMKGANWLVIANHCKVTSFFPNRQGHTHKKEGVHRQNTTVHPRIYLYKRSYSIFFEHRLLYDTLSHHSVGNLHEACHVCTLHVVYIAVRLCTILNAVLMDVLHNPEELSINFLS